MNLSRRAPEVLLSNAGYEIAQGTSLTSSRDANRLSSAVDVWSLGMLFYHVLTGHFSPYGASDAFENSRIVAGEFELLPLENAGLPAHVSRCAIDLIASMLSTEPVARPTILTLQQHPLWWQPDVVMAKAKLLYDERRELPDEALIAVNMHGADIQWWERMEPHLLERVVNHSRRAAGKEYGRAFPDLLRFVRNMHEHPPRADQLVRMAEGEHTIQDRRAMVADYFLKTLPELPLAVHFCLVHKPLE